MSRPLIYIDQNIIGLQLNGIIELGKRDDVVWVYSKEHFSEIKRANEPEKYLDVLDAIDAKLLDLILDENGKITSEAALNEAGSPHQHYYNYIAVTEDVSFDDTIFDPLQVWINGGACKGLLMELPDKFEREILNLTIGLPMDNTEMLDKAQSLKPELASMVDEMVSNGNDTEKTRAAMGGEKGAFGSLVGENQILRIWEKISSTMRGTDISCDQFFGFNPVDKQGYDVWPTYLGIIGCNAVLDLLGFQAEKKCRDLNKIQNVRSDAVHIAMGAYCSAILSNDGRLINRARAIYEYKNIDTTPVSVSRNTNKPRQ
ncbi:hypothetical protein [Glaciecola sp. SC05]|uniref:hypothetical protein n=1 Tax=Glaciecola sp. SC05 TaxID=1987355 RepID=UPI003528720D